MNRPPRNMCAGFSVSVEEKQRIQRCAPLEGMSVSEFCRAAALSWCALIEAEQREQEDKQQPATTN